MERSVGAVAQGNGKVATDDPERLRQKKVRPAEDADDADRKGQTRIALIHTNVQQIRGNWCN